MWDAGGLRNVIQILFIVYSILTPIHQLGVLSLNEVWVVGGEGGGVKSLLDVIKMTCLCCVVLYVTCRSREMWFTDCSYICIHAHTHTHKHEYTHAHKYMHTY